jgi:hypothetical protein
MRYIRGYSENEFDVQGLLERNRDRLKTTGVIRYFTLERRAEHGTDASDFNCSDLGAELLQSIKLTENGKVYFSEKVGSAHKALPSERIPFDSTLYGSIQGGFRYVPLRSGSLDVSYTVSNVRIGVDNLDYRIAGGFANGISHLVQCRAELQTSKNLSLSGNYRGELTRGYSGNRDFTNTMSLEVRAYIR